MSQVFTVEIEREEDGRWIAESRPSRGCSGHPFLAA